MARTKESEKRFKTQINIRDSFYGEYRKNEPNKIVTVELYLKIVEGFLKHLLSSLFSGKDIRIPERLGIMEITGKKVVPWVDVDGKIRGACIDKGGTKKLHETDPEAKANNTLLYHFNEHTNGVRYSLKWVKKDVNIKYKFNYYFRMSRANKRTTPKVIKEGVEFQKK